MGGERIEQGNRTARVDWSVRFENVSLAVLAWLRQIGHGIFDFVSDLPNRATHVLGAGWWLSVWLSFAATAALVSQPLYMFGSLLVFSLGVGIRVHAWAKWALSLLVTVETVAVAAAAYMEWTFVAWTILAVMSGMLGVLIARSGETDRGTVGGEQPPRANACWSYMRWLPRW